MKCKLCDRYFSQETDFLNLFEFPEICSECFEKYSPKITEEFIPIDNGMIRYLYLYETNTVNAKQREYLSKHWSILYRQMSKNMDEKVVVIIDSDFMEHFKLWIHVIKQWKSICFVSLVRFNFEGLMNFF